MNQTSNKDIIDCLQFPMYWKDKFGVYLGCNISLANIAGFSDTAHIIGKSDIELVWSEYAEKIRYSDEEVIKNDQTVILQEQIISSSGEKQNMLSIKSPLKDHDDKITGIIGISINLNHQNIINFQSEALEQLIHINKILTVRKIRHDIKGPLGSLTTFCEHILNAKNDPVKVIYLTELLFKFCNAMDEFMQSLTNSCLTENQINDKVDFNLNDLITKVYNLAKPIAYSKNLELNYESQIDQLPQLKNAKDTIFRILMELTNNAIKHSAKNSQIIIKSYLSDKSINIEISNLSTHLAGQIISLILDLDGTINDSALMKGHGFGLSMVNKLAKSIGATLKVNSQKTLETKITLVIQNA